MFARFKPELRTAIRKARNCGLQVEIGTGLDLIEKFYQLHSRTRQRQGVPVQPSCFFRSIHQYILARHMGIVAIATSADRPVAAAIFLHSDTSAIFKFGTSDPRSLSMRPNNLVMWEVIRWYLRRGVTSLHMGRTSISNGGLRRFKLAWGASEFDLPYYRIDPTRGSTMEAVDRSSAWSSRLFSLLPVPALRLIGRLFYRHID
jgi:lipid II:glycine glycyltransferase (peptidoglycan interpeptide bridge formation enzyme)